MKNFTSTLVLITLVTICSCNFASSQEETKANTAFYPEPLLLLNEFSSHHVIIAEKATHKLHLFQNKDGLPKLVKSYQMATGKKSGNKIFQGDYRTPEGIYNFIDFIPYEGLIKRHGEAGKIYGVGAFVMNYPNPIDRTAKKTGGGIWLHSTNDETRIDKGLDSRGCVVVANNHLKDISKYIELNKTPILVTHQLKYLNKESYQRMKNELQNFMNTWLESWKSEDIKNYLSHYHESKFFDKFRGNFLEFSKYKRNVFWGPGAPEISINHLAILKSKTYATITFVQNYKSKTIDDIGKKTLYLEKDTFYNWKIVSESWSKIIDVHDKKNDHVAFIPTMRFFSQEERQETN